ncbi:MAG TPA: polyprenyl synthetase family protein [Nitrososphaerales archaeon]|nr:polyprenyl synthetase family protein [Nitrososphaerales archaeon]
MELGDAEFSSYFKSKTLQYHTRIEHGLSETLARFSESRFYDLLNYAVQGGKRIRPLIVLLAYDAVGTAVPLIDDPLPAAIAVELLHTESIIHDDIIDEDTFRRDREAFHTRYGLGASILSADFVLGIILDIASQYSDSRIGRELSKSVLRMSEGEFSELAIQKEKRKITSQEYIEIIGLKTASLFQSSAKLGAIIAGGKQHTIESISDFGLNLGIAYQVQDDLLDWNQKASLENALGTEQKNLQKLSHDFAIRAKNSLANLADSDAKERLMELAEFAVRRSF